MLSRAPAAPSSKTHTPAPGLAAEGVSIPLGTPLSSAQKRLLEEVDESVKAWANAHAATAAQTKVGAEWRIFLPPPRHLGSHGQS